MKKLLLIFTLLLWLPIAHANDDEFYRGAEAFLDKRYKEAYKILKPLAEQGHARAQNQIAEMHQNGYGVPENYKEAIEWYRKSAEQGNAAAQDTLGTAYRDGELGFSVDYEEAIQWYRKGAEQGNPLPQSNLALMYYTGSGVEKNFIHAYIWQSIAVGNNQFNEFQEHYNKVLNLIKAEMSSADIEKAQAVAQQCFDSDYKDCE